ncbi:GNAT family N-acetyltransferase [uncultured Pseudoteredinibacter sp.]|uniref:GNAT family N-acetyltransferase n=1 Tax=uncultured Pseudoteredinibacter sp. TaxID=1641701 RepID=UPI00263A090D|nr:GNAT family N-acetyltransferase [uncultured Pseudoteredinibacter sp.]
MNTVKYLKFEDSSPKDLINILNEESLRKHLIEHPHFDSYNINEWISGKIETNAAKGCRVRVISIDGEIAGWCGIQEDDEGFEIAIVISQKFWGYGIRIFKTIMSWAKELGHKEVLFHLLETRRSYKSLARMARKISHRQLLGRNFSTYYLLVP